MTRTPTDRTRRTLGLVGLGAMGRGLAANAATHGWRLCAYDPDPLARRAAQQLGVEGLCVVDDAARLACELVAPRVILMAVPAAAVGRALARLHPGLEPGDTVIDAGNTHFEATRERAARLRQEGIHWLGLGVSGGPGGARTGPSLMLGGAPRAAAGIETLLRPLAAVGPAGPCFAYCGQDGAGHFTKMVHNAIEYGLMQLLAEIYAVARGCGLDAMTAGERFADWCAGPADSYLLRLAAAVLRTPDPEDGAAALVDALEGRAGHGSTAIWTLQSALDLDVPTPLLAAAVAARLAAGGAGVAAGQGGRNAPSGAAEATFASGAIGRVLLATNAQVWEEGLRVLHAGAEHHELGLDLATAVGSWCGGSLLRSWLAERAWERLVAGARPLQGELQDLVDPDNAARRELVALAARQGIAVPVLAAGLAARDGQAQVPHGAQLLEALRDAFGAHGYRRREREGRLSGDWLSVRAMPRARP